MVTMVVVLLEAGTNVTKCANFGSLLGLMVLGGRRYYVSVVLCNALSSSVAIISNETCAIFFPYTARSNE